MFVNAELLKLGMARYHNPSAAPLRYRQLFQACERLAREKGVGIWKQRKE